MGDTGMVRRSHSPMPTTMTTRTVKDGQEEFGEVVAEIGWGNYGGSILPPKKKPKGASDGYSGTGTSSSYEPSAYSYSPGTGAAPYSPGRERAGFAGWNENGSTGRGESPVQGASANSGSGANGSGSGLSRSGSRSGSTPVLANRNRNGASKFDLSKVDPNTFPMGDTGTVRRSHSPTPTTMTTWIVKDGKEEFGEGG
ncbi:hypothetical protein B0H14DRAFT_3140496 [Mycena olivaceomarginata]|nr:hypothetical protein B0H14DRAFT_3140496 [Mycena olivaceomarginata]